MLENSSCIRHIKVDTVTIDSLCGQLDVEHIDVIKMDAEGVEPLILLGADNLFSSGQPRFILMEFSPSNWKGYGSLLERLFDKFAVFEIRRYPAAVRLVRFSGLPKDRQTMLLLTRKTREPTEI